MKLLDKKAAKEALFITVVLCTFSLLVCIGIAIILVSTHTSYIFLLTVPVYMWLVFYSAGILENHI